MLALWVLAATLAGSAMAYALAAVLFLQPSHPHWFGKAAGVWFGGGLAALILATRGRPRRSQLVGFSSMLAVNAVLIVPLYRGTPTLIDGYSKVWDDFALTDLPIRDAASFVFSIVAYLVGPQVAAAAGQAVASTCRSSARVGSDPDRKDLRAILKTSRRLLLPMLLFVGMIWGALEMPTNVFGNGSSRRGSRFCRTTEDCRMRACGWQLGCFSLPPHIEIDLQFSCAAPDPRTHCACKYSVCRAINARSRSAATLR